MPNPSDNVVPLQPNKPNLQTRVQRKRELLQDWLDHGIPHDKVDTLPSSLNGARTWDDPDLGIFPIGSPNNFTTGHREVGRDVEAIRKLIIKLQAKVARPHNKRRSAASKPTISAKDVEEVISHLVSQWHAAREDARRQRVRAELAESHRDLARKDLRDKEAELAELRRRNSRRLTLIR